MVPDADVGGQSDSLSDASNAIIPQMGSILLRPVGVFSSFHQRQHDTSRAIRPAVAGVA